jgi:branched-chain amino acid transport system ATP-binding protein
MTALLRLEALSKSYGALAVTRDVSLDVAPGEVHALIGPNGAGKTTLVGQIAGSLRPDRGRVVFGGRDITALPPQRRARLGLARSFQIITLIPGFTARENVAVAVQRRHGSSFRFLRDAGRERRLNEEAEAALESVGLASRAAVMAAVLSHGEKRQLELAVALACAPKLLLLDEPMAGVGHEEAAGLLRLLQSLRGRFAMLLVEHDMEAVFALSDRVSVLVAGALIATGTPAAIRADPAVRAAYLGDDQVPRPADGDAAGS